MHVVNNAIITGISSTVPNNKINNEISLKKKSLVKHTGVKYRYFSRDKNLKTSDLCVSSASNLLKKTKIKPHEIDYLIFVSQTRDFLIPSTAFSIQNKLKLKKNILAFDIPLGCSGFIYGLYLSFMISSTNKNKGLLLCGDMSSTFVDKKNESISSLFGDAGTASLIEYKKNTKSFFSFASDGVGYDNIILKNPNFYPQKKNDKYLDMDGAKVFQFAITEVPKQINDLLIKNNINIGDIDFFVFHQANKFIIDHIKKKMSIPNNKILFSLEKFGNTNSASIPITLNSNQSKIKNKPKKLLLCGFGVGLSWGSSIIDIDDLILTKIYKV